MADYTQLKVPDLKKALAERGLVVSGNKADLIARLQEDDTKKKGGAGGSGANKQAAGGEDEIDWDEDDKATTAPAAAAIAAGGVGPVDTPAAVPNQKIDVETHTTSDLKVAGGKDAPVTADSTVKPSDATSATPAAAPEAPKQDFSRGIEQSDADKEAEKRAARAQRFAGMLPESNGATDEEEKRKAERAKKFGLVDKPDVVKGLDSALPERRQKRGREERGGAQGGRNAKRQTPDRRTEAPANKANAKPKKPAGRILDDPEEKKKAEARAARFAAAAE